MDELGKRASRASAMATEMFGWIAVRIFRWAPDADSNSSRPGDTTITPPPDLWGADPNGVGICRRMSRITYTEAPG
jgi:hypothetical protein